MGILDEDMRRIVGRGETIVVGGGGGGVGSAAVQMAAACGGTLRPRIGARLSLADSAEAHSRQESGNTGGGRILVTSR